MNILVLICGIADPKYPLPRDISVSALEGARAAHVLLSPFDEAALEIALKLRDTNPAVHITALVLARSAMDPLLRTVGSLRPDVTRGLDSNGLPAWDGLGMARVLADAVSQLEHAPDLLLLGRELGDYDDGTAPVAVAQALRMNYSKLIFSATLEGACVHGVRQNAAQQESIRLALPAVLSVTNDARNKLRHPLLKNVMEVKKIAFKVLNCLQTTSACVQLANVGAAVERPRSTVCQMVSGDTDAQVEMLAALLLEKASAQ